MELVTSFIGNFLALWQSGGILMWPLLFLAIFIYWNLFELFSKFSQYDFQEIQQMAVSGIMDGYPDRKAVRNRVNIVKAEYLPHFERRLGFLSILAGVSPLLGLLGTVMGMLSTFSLMNSGDTKKVDLMAGGISEALITTQMGLIIAVPAILMIVTLRGKRDSLKSLFNKVEAECLISVVKTEGTAT